MLGEKKGMGALFERRAEGREGPVFKPVWGGWGIAEYCAGGSVGVPYMYSVRLCRPPPRPIPQVHVPTNGLLLLKGPGFTKVAGSEQLLRLKTKRPPSPWTQTRLGKDPRKVRTPGIIVFGDIWPYLLWVTTGKLAPGN